MRRPIQRMANVYADVLIGKYALPLANDKAAERPVAITDREFATPRIIEFGYVSDGDFNFSHGSFQGATLNSSNIPGIAENVQNKKNVVQPICSTIKPVTELANILGTEANAEKSAN